MYKSPLKNFQPQGRHLSSESQIGQRRTLTKTLLNTHFSISLLEHTQRWPLLKASFNFSTVVVSHLRCSIKTIFQKCQKMFSYGKTWGRRKNTMHSPQRMIVSQQILTRWRKYLGRLWRWLDCGSLGLQIPCVSSKTKTSCHQSSTYELNVIIIPTISTSLLIKTKTLNIITETAIMLSNIVLLHHDNPKILGHDSGLQKGQPVCSKNHDTLWSRYLSKQIAWVPI